MSTLSFSPSASGRFADIVGRERVIAGTDCGFGPAEPDIAYLKFMSLAEGAELASRGLWGGA